MNRRIWQTGSLIWALAFGLIVGSTTNALAASDIIWGANGHPFSAYDGVTVSEQISFLRDLGVRYYRVDVRSEDDAPALARLIAAAQPRGIKILPVITPNFNLDKESSAQLRRKAYDLARTLVGQFKEHIPVWELGNEMEEYAIIRACEIQDNGVQYNCSWGPAGGTRVLDYYGPRWAKVSAVLKGLSEGVVSVDPSIRKAIGTAGWGHWAAFTRMQQDGIKWDISVWHSYSLGMEDGLDYLSKFKRPIWLTEFNHPRGSEKGEARQSEGLRRMVRRIRQLRKRYNLEAAFVYELFDEPYWAPSFEAMMGLIKLKKNNKGGWRPGEPKQAFFAFKTMIHSWNPNEIAPTQKKKRSQNRNENKRVSNIKGLRQGCKLSDFLQFDNTDNNQIAYSFCLVLGREPDGGGLSSWRASLKNGQTVTAMLSMMLESTEFMETFKTKSLDEAEFTEFLYRLLLDRNPDGGEFLGRLAHAHSGTPRRSFAKKIVMSDEFRRLHHVLFPSQEGERKKKAKGQ
ncbi:MAG: DUF4214 domain-containing protein [Hyphomicrobiaceae bacterium]